MTVPETRKDHITFGRVRRAQGGRRGRHWQRSAVDRLERLEERFQKLHQLKGRIMTQYTSQRAREATVGTNSGSGPHTVHYCTLHCTHYSKFWSALSTQCTANLAHLSALLRGAPVGNEVERCSGSWSTSMASVGGRVQDHNNAIIVLQVLMKSRALSAECLLGLQHSVLSSRGPKTSKSHKWAKSGHGGHQREDFKGLGWQSRERYRRHQPDPPL